MASVLSRRLGKRSLLGTRVSAPGALSDGVLAAPQIHAVLPDDVPCPQPAEESSRAPRFPSPSRRQQVRKEAFGRGLCVGRGEKTPGGAPPYCSARGKLQLRRAADGRWCWVWNILPRAEGSLLPPIPAKSECPEKDGCLPVVFPNHRIIQWPELKRTIMIV